MNAEQKNLNDAVDKAMQLIVEHAEAVVIFALRTENGEDHKCVAATGSSYARHAMVEEEFLKWQEYVKAHARHMQNKEYPNDEPEDE